ncbi:MAG: Nucleotidyltransferase [Candidatus Amesbacteria bacterium GW2011_GWA2_42_12]|uniref:Nucleotidyltransferase n=1 Tax=Candidatus Amesbacteria bacterium GW2011_GWA2_42_12 TaxID=1618356 RepID=A0A0G0Y746_9BACT|nr:MAG: Nucleotidyltransferase [Candidatus Amesbacteria bacterium GW2011_GWA2_42_12]
MVDAQTTSIIRTIIKRYLPNSDYKIFVFGSRVQPQHRKFSDLDIGILGPSKISGETLVRIKTELGDSDIPYLTDVVDFSTVHENFRKRALSNTISL